jgi:hypothetical protein
LEARGRPEQWAFLAATALAFADGVRLVAAARDRTPRTAVLSDIEDRGAQVAGYLATYLLPFIGGPPASWRTAGAYAVYFAIALLVSAHADAGLINPTLYLFGYRVVAATVRGRRVLVVCPGGRLAPGSHRVHRMMGGAGFVLAERGDR